MTATEDIPAAIRATWPPRSVRTLGPFELADGGGGGNRVSAARLRDPASDGGDLTRQDIDAVADAQTAEGAERLFMVFGWQRALDRALDAEGYAIRDETLILSAPTARLAEPPPPVSCFEIWPPLAVQEEIWAGGGIGPERLAIMHRAEGPKTTLFGRINDRPAGTAFIAVHGGTAMLHALEIATPARRLGLGRLMVRAGAHWARSVGASEFTVLVTRANGPAQGLYASLGLQPVENYHYRVK
jgi:GNAT superfamily N-acetyltransferase